MSFHQLWCSCVTQVFRCDRQRPISWSWIRILHTREVSCQNTSVLPLQTEPRVSMPNSSQEKSYLVWHPKLQFKILTVSSCIALVFFLPNKCSEFQWRSVAPPNQSGELMCFRIVSGSKSHPTRSWIHKIYISDYISCIQLNQQTKPKQTEHCLVSHHSSCSKSSVTPFRSISPLETPWRSWILIAKQPAASQAWITGPNPELGKTGASLTNQPRLWMVITISLHLGFSNDKNMLRCVRKRCWDYASTIRYMMIIPPSIFGTG